MKILAISLLVAGVSGSALAGSACSSVADYEVPKTSFSQMTASDAVSRILTGTPFQSVFAGTPSRLVSAMDVSGPLDQVLDALSEQAGVTYTLNQCVLTFTPIPPKVDKPLPLPTWNITLADKSIRLLLGRWCHEANYQLLWEIPVDLEIGASATFTGTFEDALKTVFASLSNSAYPAEAIIYDNHVVRVVKHSSRNN